MKVVIEIDDYILDTDIDSDWVNVCNDELAESLNNAVKLSDVLQEIRQEMAESKYNHRGEYNRELAFNICLQIIDNKLKEIERSERNNKRRSNRTVGKGI